MKFYLALVAVCAAFTGPVQATLSVPFPTETRTSKMDPALLEYIFEGVVQQTEYTYSEVREMYAEDRMKIYKGEQVYVVELLDADGGGLAILEIEDNL